MTLADDYSWKSMVSWWNVQRHPPSADCRRIHSYFFVFASSRESRALSFETTKAWTVRYRHEEEARACGQPRNRPCVLVGCYCAIHPCCFFDFF